LIWDDRTVIYRVAGWTVALAVAAVTVTIVRDDPADSLAGDSRLALTVGIIAGLLLVAAGLTARASTPFRLLLAASGIAWLATEWNSPAAGAAFSAGLVVYAAWPPLLSHAALRYPDRSLSRPERALLAVAYADCLLLLGAATAFFFDPVGQDCRDCPANRLLLDSDPQAVYDLGRGGLLVAGVWAATFAAVALLRLARSSWARRWVEIPVLVPAAIAVAVFGARALHGRERGFLSNDPTDRALLAAEAAALVLVAAGVAWTRVRARRMRAELTQLVVDLGESPPPGGLRDQLAHAFGDPSLDLLHAQDDGERWIDSAGVPADIRPGPDRQVTRLLAGSRELSAVVHRPGLFEQPAIAAELADAARLALEHERLNALRRAHLQSLRASRGRIVAEADSERRSLERDLHDGAQQRLATLAVSIRLARRQLAADDQGLDAELASAEEGLREALAELRELAHGLIPAVLAHEGLKPAVEALADRAPWLVVGDLPSGRFAAPVESAAYFLVAESVRRAGGANVAVRARREEERLVVELEAPAGIGVSTVDLEDRVGAVGGTLTGTTRALSAEMPCGS
jgi:signal transduction histidine kinase